MAVDPDTYARYVAAEKKAHDQGYALVEVLDHNRLLLTKRLEHQLTVAAVEQVCRRLDRQSPNKLMSHYLGRVDGTPAEMLEAVKMWFEAVCRNMANGTLEDL